MAQNYQTQFTKEMIVNLKNAINMAVNEYASKEVEGGKLDIFVILAALNQAEYELVLRSFPQDDNEAQKAHDEMLLIADKQIKLIDDTRKEHNTKAMSELLATTHVSSVLAEFYARRRDEYIEKMEKENAVVQNQ